MKYEEFLDDLLRHTKRRAKLMELGAGVVIFFAALVAFLTLAVILDHTVTLPRLARWVVLVCLNGAVVAGLMLAGGLLLRRLSDLYAARLIERNYPQFRNTLISYLEARGLSDVPAGIKAYIEEQATEKALRVNPDVVVSPRRLVMGAYALLAAFLVFFFYAVFTHKSVAVALRRIWHPAADIPPATATRIVEVQPGSTAALIGSDLPVRVELRGVIPKRVLLRWSREQELWQSLELSPSNEGRRWQTTLADLEHDLYYYIEAGDARSPLYHLVVVPTPLVTSLETRYRFPSYSGLPERVTYRGDVEALEGTVVTVRAHTNTTLSRARLFLNDRPLEAVLHHPAPGEQPGDIVEASFTVTRSGQYCIRLEDPYGFTNPDPPRYEVLCRYDQPPTVRIVEPRGDVRLPLEEPLRIRFEAADDLGLAGLQFRYKAPGRSEEGVLPLPLPARVREFTSEVTVHLDRLGVEPGQSLACYLQATDTFPETPHIARSDTLVVLVPLPEELTEAYAQAPASEAQPAPSQGPPQPREQSAAGAGPGEPGPQPAREERPEGAAEAAESAEAGESAEAALEQLVARDWPIFQTIRRHLEGEGGDQAQAGQAPPQPQGLAGREPAQGQAPSGGARQAPARAGADLGARAGATSVRADVLLSPQAGSGDSGSAEEPTTAGSAGRAASAERSRGAGSQGQQGESGPSEGEPSTSSGTAASEGAGGVPESASAGSPAAGAPTAESGSRGGAPSGAAPGEAGAEEAGAGEAAPGGGGGERAVAGQQGSGPERGGASADAGAETGETSGSAGRSGESRGEGRAAGESAEAGAEAGARGEGSRSASGSSAEGAAGRAGSAGSPQAQGSGARSLPGGDGQEGARGEPVSPAVTAQPGGGDGTQGGGGGGGTTGREPPELRLAPESPSPQVSGPDLKVAGRIIEELFDRLRRNDINPELLEDLHWDVQDLAAWVVAYKARLGELAQERPDAGVPLGVGVPAPEAPPAERVIEMATPTKPVTPTVGEATTEISPDELRELFQGAKGTVSPEYRQLLEDYYKALAGAAAP